MKSYVGAHNIYHDHNIYAYVTFGFSAGFNSKMEPQLAGFNDIYTNNTVVLNVDGENYGLFECGSIPQSEWPVLGNNTVSTPSGNATKTGLCDMDEQNFQNKYNTDLGTVITPLPDDNTLLAQAKSLLWT